MTRDGLINKNARLYDPVVGRFLSPDPYIQAPDFSQNFNRYSYALNNPLIYTDPNGEFLLPAILIGAAVGGTINLAYKAMNGQIHNFGDGLMAFGVGPAAGGIAAATGGAAFVAAGGGAAGAGGFLAGALSGMIGYISSAPFENLANHFAFGDPIMSPADHVKGLALSGITAGVINRGSALANGKNIWNGQSVADGRTQFSFKNTPVKPKYNPTETRNEVKLLNAKGSTVFNKQLVKDAEKLAKKLDIYTVKPNGADDPIKTKQLLNQMLSDSPEPNIGFETTQIGLQEDMKIKELL